MCAGEALRLPTSAVQGAGCCQCVQARTCRLRSSTSAIRYRPTAGQSGPQVRQRSSVSGRWALEPNRRSCGSGRQARSQTAGRSSGRRSTRIARAGAWRPLAKIAPESVSFSAECCQRRRSDRRWPLRRQSRWSARTKRSIGLGALRMRGPRRVVYAMCGARASSVPDTPGLARTGLRAWHRPPSTPGTTGPGASWVT
jgi:hypothetical protein